MSTITLFEKKQDCCGCMACLNVCPKQAIKVVCDEYGFYYPEINEDQCIQCGRCQRVCNYQNRDPQGSALGAFAAVSADDALLMGSSSGAMFASVAQEVIASGGVVYGCSLEKEDGSFVAKHIRVSDTEELYRLQGSKYVHSLIGDAYSRVKTDLDEGRTVLFTGTPCQIAGLRGFLQNKDHPNLFLIDLICHGVPSITFFRDYIDCLEKKNRISIDAFDFRDKKYGWSVWGSAVYHTASGAEKRLRQNRHNSAFYKLFLDSDIYRENCYSCKYANEKRQGDITIGDFWGIENVHPELLSTSGGDWDRSKGISCLLVNTQQGFRLLESFGKRINRSEVEFEQIARKNKQLTHPCQMSEKRAAIMKRFKQEGYAAIQNQFEKKLGYKKMIYKMWDAVPYKTKRKIRAIAGKQS